MNNKITQFLFHKIFLLLRPLTLGVRGICVDTENNKILLVKHTYSNNWTLPGGGVEVNESVEEALKRELKEEVGLIYQEINILGIYHNSSVSRRDHVAIYQVRSWKKSEMHKRPKLEISKTNWFSIENLPSNLSESTLCAINKYYDNLNEIEQ